MIYIQKSKEYKNISKIKIFISKRADTVDDTKFRH